MHHIFVSYSRRDGEWVNRLLETLAEADLATWVDQRDIPVSVPWVAEIRDAIEEACLFLICDSASSQASEACAAEAAIARDCAKPIYRVAVGDDLSQCRDAIFEQVRLMTRQQRAQTELLVRARDWARAGRRSSDLVGPRERSRLAQSRPSHGSTSAVERAFLGASRRRSIRRRVIAAGGTALALSVVGAAALVRGAQDLADRGNATQAIAYEQTRESLNVVGGDPYSGLGRAAALGENEGVADAAVLMAALDNPVPDDSFTVPPGAATFADRPVNQNVVVTAADGSTWTRSATDRNQRSANRDDATSPSTPASDAPTATIDSHTGLVTIQERGSLYRRLLLSSPTSTVAISPDGRFLAAGSRRSVQIVDIETGDEQTELRGTTADITDVAWDRTGERVWAVAGRTVVSWQVIQGTVVLDEPGEWFQAILPAQSQDQAWIAARNGQIREVALESGRVTTTRSVPDEILSAGADRKGRIAVVIGRDRDWIVSLTADHDVPFTLKNCVEGRPAITADAADILIPCLQGPIVVVDPHDGHEIRRITVPAPGASSAITVTPQTGRILASGDGGDLYQVDLQLGSARSIYAPECHPSVLSIAVSYAEDAITSVGQGTGMISCSEVGLFNGDDEVWNHYVDSPRNSVQANAAAFDASGRLFAVGYSDGSVVLHPTKNILPTVTLHVSGAVRDLFVSRGSNDLYVATRTGVLQRIHLCPNCMTNAALAQQARRIAKRALAIGLATKRS